MRVHKQHQPMQRANSPYLPALRAENQVVQAILARLMLDSGVIHTLYRS